MNAKQGKQSEATPCKRIAKQSNAKAYQSRAKQSKPKQRPAAATAVAAAAAAKQWSERSVYAKEGTAKQSNTNPIS